MCPPCYTKGDTSTLTAVPSTLNLREEGSADEYLAGRHAVRMKVGVWICVVRDKITHFVSVNFINL